MVSGTPLAAFAFTKLVVRDLERMATFYSALLELGRGTPIRADIEGLPVEEIILETREGAGLILLKWLSRVAPEPSGVILGITTHDITALFDRGRSAGGGIRESPRGVAEAGGLTVGFLEDPEGRLIEVVELPG